MTSKKVSDSKTEMSQLMLPEHASQSGMVYGGTLLSIADSVAFVCATRHCGPNCVTASVERVDFREPIRIGELVIFKASMHFAGKTSMQVGIQIYAENVETGKQRLTNTCIFTMVQLDEKGKPKPVPELTLETDEEKKLFEEAEKRYKAAKERGKQSL